MNVQVPTTAPASIPPVIRHMRQPAHLHWHAANIVALVARYECPCRPIVSGDPHVNQHDAIALAAIALDEPYLGLLWATVRYWLEEVSPRVTLRFQRIRAVLLVEFSTSVLQPS
jgi:hypothetical protein